ncbi:protein kinase IKS1 NDAI_0G05790 [Naumovozyma dairenensis CBS 421]|uniref:Protein kinase domain-containing protein n=1 Tax=Naumovozyma dairenensis (strain ATCC 10597 / BCRC 20456 / CBS 421 / NBRC 0211 / NRRL Y-12639) TaxID=1071378 RepID=J7RTJ5_NAUDC|nr:hypothetical protein NDAI_0G05790 [Naumovozyma dairenensis CBS 421]CCK73562.1 hypothetical protein NDAI_0G05790 [Naumovozyma dairenensis CBS 421]
MSLVPYRDDDSLILSDPTSNSLLIVNPISGKLSYFQQVPTTPPQYGSTHSTRRTHIHQRPLESLSSYICPQCGTEINQDSNFPSTPRFKLPKRYFQLLQSTHKQTISQSSISDIETSPQQIQNNNNKSFFIPPELFIPGYFHKFFTTLSLLGNGARGSVFKVVHKIGDTNLGIFALKKIPIGNDMIWFNKCIREVKALSSLTHKSANLITYNHVWLEMDDSCGVVPGATPEVGVLEPEKIPCLFILQQFCEGGNLEDCIERDVFAKAPNLESIEERKRRFRLKRDARRNNNNSLDGDHRQGLSSRQIISILRDIARGLHELHDIGLIHRDLKPSNCLLLQKYKEGDDLEFPTVVIGDLGESQMEGEARIGTGATGTLEFTAPEVIISDTMKRVATGMGRDYNEYTYAADIYSLGMICYFIIFGELPFNSELNIPELKEKVKSFKFNKRAMLEQHRSLKLLPIDHRIFDLMESLLSPSVSTRPTAKEVEDLLDSLLMNHEDGSAHNFDNEDNLSILEQPVENASNKNTSEVDDEIIEESEEDDDDGDEKIIEEIMNDHQQLPMFSINEQLLSLPAPHTPSQSHQSSNYFSGVNLKFSVVTFLTISIICLPKINVHVVYFTLFLYGMYSGTPTRTNLKALIGLSVVLLWLLTQI